MPSDEKWDATFAATFENMSKWIRASAEYADLTEEQLRKAWATPGFEEAWRLNREHLALRYFTTYYQDREYSRWLAGKPSIALEAELQPVVSFIASFPDPDAVWKAVNAYSAGVINHIYKVGTQLPESDDAPGKQVLSNALLPQIMPVADFMEKTLKEL